MSHIYWTSIICILKIITSFDDNLCYYYSTTILATDGSARAYDLERLCHEGRMPRPKGEWLLSLPSRVVPRLVLYRVLRWGFLQLLRHCARLNFLAICLIVKYADFPIWLIFTTKFIYVALWRWVPARYLCPNCWSHWSALSQDCCFYVPDRLYDRHGLPLTFFSLFYFSSLAVAFHRLATPSISHIPIFKSLFFSKISFFFH